MDIRDYCDDFFSIGNVAILHREIDNDGYDFSFRNHFECKSIISGVDAPVLLHIGAIEDYEGVNSAVEELGMKLLVSNTEHHTCSTIERWYPLIKEKIPFTKVYDGKNFLFHSLLKGIARQTITRNRSALSKVQNNIRNCVKTGNTIGSSPGKK